MVNPRFFHGADESKQIAKPAKVAEMVPGVENMDSESAFFGQIVFENRLGTDLRRAQGMLSRKHARNRALALPPVQILALRVQIFFGGVY